MPRKVTKSHNFDTIGKKDISKVPTESTLIPPYTNGPLKALSLTTQ